MHESPPVFCCQVVLASHSQGILDGLHPHLIANSWLTKGVHSLKMFLCAFIDGFAMGLFGKQQGAGVEVRQGGTK